MVTEAPVEESKASPSKREVSREEAEKRSVCLNKVGQELVSGPEVKIFTSGPSIDIEGEGAEPLLEYHLPDGKVLTELRFRLGVCLFDQDCLVPGTLNK